MQSPSLTSEQTITIAKNMSHPTLFAKNLDSLGVQSLGILGYDQAQGLRVLP